MLPAFFLEMPDTFFSFVEAYFDGRMQKGMEEKQREKMPLTGKGEKKREGGGDKDTQLSE